MGVTVPVIYQRADGSAHVIAAVHAGDGTGVDLLDAQKGEVAEAADVLAATGMWVIPVPGAEVDREGFAAQWFRAGQPGLGAGLPTEVMGPKRRGGVSGPVARKAGTKRTPEEVGQGSRGEADQGSARVKRREVDAAAVVGAVSGVRVMVGGGYYRDGSGSTAGPECGAEMEEERTESEAVPGRNGCCCPCCGVGGVEGAGATDGDQEAELAEPRSKAQQWQKKKGRGREAAPGENGCCCPCCGVGGVGGAGGR